MMDSNFMFHKNSLEGSWPWTTWNRDMTSLSLKCCVDNMKNTDILGEGSPGVGCHVSGRDTLIKDEMENITAPISAHLWLVLYSRNVSKLFS